MVLVWRARSGRRIAISPARTALTALVAALLLATLLAGLSVYTPLLHSLAGDAMVSATPRHLANKVAQDNTAALVNVATVADPPSESALPTVRIHVDPQAYASLNHDILRYGLGELEKKPRVDAWVEPPGGGLLRASLMYRGTNSWHHQSWKPSLRIRFKRKRLADGYRELVLIAPEDPPALRNWLSDDLGRRWDVLTPQEEHVRVFLNNSFLGLYTRVRRLDESLCIDRDLLPAPFFRMENRTGPVFRRTQASFRDPSGWEIIGLEPDEGRGVLRRLTNTLKLPPSPARQERLNRLIDGRAFARWLALLTHAAEVHTGDHNIAFRLDPGSGLLAPVLIDVNGYDWATPGHRKRPLIVPGNACIDAWLADPRNLARYVDALDQLLSGLGDAAYCTRLVRERWALCRPDALADLHTSGLGARNGTYTRTLFPISELDANVDALCELLQERTAWLREQLEWVCRVVLVRKTSRSFTVVVQGYAGVTATRVDSSTFRVGRREVRDRATLLPSMPRGVLREGPREVASSFTLTGQPDDYRFEHRLSGRVLKPIPQAEPAPTGLHPHVFARLRTSPVVLGPGELEITRTLTTDPGQPMTIRAGTTLRLGPGVSLIARGPLQVEGSRAQPVRIRRLDPSQPFGVLAVLGARTGGSILTHLDIEGGSVDRIENLVLSGMVSVHDCPALVLQSCRFGPNAVGDDTVHLVRCQVRVVDCLVEDARADGMDWDKVDGVLEACRFRRCGNDGLDLSQGVARITGCEFEDCGDKCLSVGEGARAVVQASRLARGQLGMAVKDRSQVLLLASELVDNQHAIGVYRKKWRWGRGGSVWIGSTSWRGSRSSDLLGDRRSQVVLLDRPGMDPRVLGALLVQQAER